MTRPARSGALVPGRHAAEYSEASRQADNAMRTLFMRRTALERERNPSACLPSGGGEHRQLSLGLERQLNALHGLAAARRFRGIL